MTDKKTQMRFAPKNGGKAVKLLCLEEGLYSELATTPHKNIETNSRFTTKIDISSHMESVNFQSGNDETAKNREVARGLGSRLPSR